MSIAISIVALVLSIVSLSWQAWSWRRNGPVIRVKVTNAITDAYRTSGDAEHYVCVEAVNIGRAATSITGWGIELPGKGSIYVTRPLRLSESLPCRLEPHSKASFFIEADALREQRHARSVPFTSMRPWVDLGDGKRIHSKKTVPLAD